jgi:serine/threonine protein kinase/Flp pilus assembly protein TadD
MKCPNCGGELPDAGGRCLRCKAPSSIRSQATTGTLPSMADDSAETVFAAPPISGTSRELSSEIDGEIVAHPPGSGVDDAATVFASSSSSPDDAETRFAPPPSQVSGHSPDTTGLPVSAGGRPAKARGPLEVGQRFGARYHILRQLGIGGMGAVYQAWDAELGVAVALKVIRPEVTRDPAAAQDIERRFKQELLLARQVTHKNVVRIHDLGEIDGIKYITMPYIEGQDLASVLRNERLTVPKVMAFARQVAAGLQAAHEAGVVHRDLKPANVMIEGEHAIIMDFGIARSTSRGGAPPPRPAPAASGSAGAASLDFSADAEMTRIAETVVGEVIGTIEYMAPEQARGEHVDQRADVYAFGLIIYDLLTGRRRSEHAVSAVGELQKRLAQPPPSIRNILPDIPLPLDQLITKCTEPDAANRYQTTTELVAAIERLDDNGKLRPIKRAIRLPYAVATVVVLLGLSGYIWWAMRPPVIPENVSVIIADFVNPTGDAGFNATLGQTLRRALQDAAFISAYDRASLPQIGVQLPPTLDEAAARGLAVKQGLGVVLSGAVAAKGSGFEISVKAMRPVTGEVITTEASVAPSRDRIIETATRLMARVRSALGDQTSESAQLFAMRSLSTSSLDVLTHYAAAVEAQAAGKFDQAQRSYEEAVKLDPNFGLGYQGLAAISRNFNRPADAEKYIKQAFKLLGGMTDREKFATRGLYYRIIGDNQQCAKEYGDSLARYPADSVAHNQRAGCLLGLRQMREAMNAMRQASQMLPNHTGYRANLALLAALAGEFQMAADEAQKLPMQDPRVPLIIAYSQLGRGMFPQARETYQKLSSLGVVGASSAALGLGDLALYEGRFSDAVKELERGVTADLTAKNAERAAFKLTAIGYAHAFAGHNSQAIAAAEKALEYGKGMAVRFMAARVFVEAGAIDKAKPLADSLSSELAAEPQAHGKIVAGLIALKQDKARDAIKLLTDANTQLDTWIGHFDLGRAYLAADAPLQAQAEFDRCMTRRGEALSLMNEGPTYGHFPFLYYFQGRVREAQGDASFAESYKTYLGIRGASTDDPLVSEVRRRMKS